MNYLKSLILKFDIPLRQNQVTMFRGAVVAIDDNRSDILFHSHDTDSLRYAYPLIQYKTINGLAAIVAIDESGFEPEKGKRNCFQRGDHDLALRPCMKA